MKNKYIISCTLTIALSSITMNGMQLMIPSKAVSIKKSKSSIMKTIKKNGEELKTSLINKNLTRSDQCFPFVYEFSSLKDINHFLKSARPNFYIHGRLLGYSALGVLIINHKLSLEDKLYAIQKFCQNGTVPTNKDKQLACFDLCERNPELENILCLLGLAHKDQGSNFAQLPYDLLYVISKLLINTASPLL